MSKRIKTVSDLQKHLVHSIVEAIENKIIHLCVETVQRYLEKNVYQAYVPNMEKWDSYDRTYDLLNSVTVANLKVGRKHITFEIFMDTDKIHPQIRRGMFGYSGWNAHADVFNIDVSEYIPLWVEEGTEGSLWDREPAYYMYDSWVELSGGKLVKELANALRREGWNVTEVV